VVRSLSPEFIAAVETIYCWSKDVDEDRLEEWETRLILAEVSYVVDKPVKRKRWRLSSYSVHRAGAEELMERYGGRVTSLLPGQWQPQPSLDGGVRIKIRDSLLVTGTDDADSLSVLQNEHPKRIILSFPPQLAFGTGAHPTTAGCLRFLADFARRHQGRNWRVLDLGCGSGILAIAAAKLGASSIMAVENDDMALGYARQNAERHGVASRIEFVEGDAIELMGRNPECQYDLIAANLFSNLLSALFPLFPAHLAKGGELIISGFLATQAEAISAGAGAVGLPLRTFVRRGKWMAARGIPENT